MTTEKNINFAIEPNFYVKVEDTTFGVDKRVLTRNSEEFNSLILTLDEEENFLNLNNDESLTANAFNVVMMFYYTPSWCTFNITNEHYSIIWQIVYACHKYNFHKMLIEVEKYLIENCNFVFETLKVASHFNLKNLRKKCISHLSTNWISEDKMEGLKELSNDDLISLIKFQNQFINKSKK